MKLTIDSSQAIELTLQPKSTAGALAQEMFIIMRSVLGEVPCYREFGMNFAHKDMPQETARGMYISSLMEAFRKFLPEVTVRSVTVTPRADGKFQSVIEVTVNE